MNQSPVRPRPQAPQTPKAPPRKPSSDLTVPVLIAAVALALVASILLVTLFGRTPVPGKTSAESTAPPDAPVNDPNHVAVTYPTTPSRSSYVLTGNGSAIDPASISAASAVLVRLSDFSVVASVDPDARISPASMTKIMTLIVACEHLEDATVTLTIDHDLYSFCAKAEATTLTAPAENYPVVNDSFTATSLLYAVGIISAADACLALANHVAGSEEAFVQLMNEKVAALGLTQTRFVNCTGLDTGTEEENYSTVREIAAILAYALDNPFCKEILSTNQTAVAATWNGEPRLDYTCYLNNTLSKRLLSAGYQQKLPQTLTSGITLLGGKTGFTDKGKFCLAAFAKDESGNLYITVTAAGESSASSVTDMAAIYKAHS